MKKYIFLFSLVILVSAVRTYAQQRDTTVKDTNYVKPPLFDTTLVNKEIFSLLNETGPAGNKVKVVQTIQVLDAFNRHIEHSKKRKISGFRIRLFFDNSQNSRSKSEHIVGQFAQLYPSIPVYRIYTNPYFKVTVGDFRTKSEAVKLLKDLSYLFPAAFLVKETINFPPL